MVEKIRRQANDAEISLINIAKLLKTSSPLILKSTLICLLLGIAHYFTVPKMYAASASIEMATVAGNPVEAPSFLLEKIKLPQYFSPKTLEFCGVENGLNSQDKFVDKIKTSVSINKSAPFVNFVIQARSTYEAKECLNALIAEVARSQDTVYQRSLQHKKQKLHLLREQQKLTEEIGKKFPTLSSKKVYDFQFSALTTYNIFGSNIAIEANNLRSQISTLEEELLEPKTHPLRLVNPPNFPADPVNKRPFSIMTLSILSGVLLGILASCLQRLAPKIRGL